MLAYALSLPPYTQPQGGLCTPPPPAQFSLPFCRQNGHKGKLGERAGLVTVSCVPSVDVTVVLDQKEF